MMRESVRVVGAALRLAAWLRAQAIDTWPGSMHRGGPCFPHPANWTAASRNQLIKSLKELAPVAEAHGVYVGLEGHQLVTQESAEVMKAVLDEVGSPSVRCSEGVRTCVAIRQH